LSPWLDNEYIRAREAAVSAVSEPAKNAEQPSSTRRDRSSTIMAAIRSCDQ
jgi:hypothetical protein